MATTQAMAPIPELTLGPGMQIKFEALDPATSLAVAGVTVSRVSIVGQKSGAHVAEVALRNLMRSTPPRRRVPARAPAPRGRRAELAARRAP
jgi:hypothetical protein